MATLHLVCGLSGSGKSTLARQIERDLPALRLTPDETGAFSPIAHIPAKAGPLIVAYGGGELPELQRQSETYAIAWRQSGLDGATLRLPGHNHFSILEELAAPDGRLGAVLAAEFA